MDNVINNNNNKKLKHIFSPFLFGRSWWIRDGTDAPWNWNPFFFKKRYDWRGAYSFTVYLKISIYISIRNRMCLVSKRWGPPDGSGWRLQGSWNSFLLLLLLQFLSLFTCFSIFRFFLPPPFQNRWKDLGRKGGIQWEVTRFPILSAE